MKKILTIPMLLLSLTLGATTYYVSTTGNDGTGTGAISTPWLTILKGMSEVSAGDTLYIRGGTYTPVGTFRYDYVGYAGAYVNNVDGTAENPIVMLNYPDEDVIIDCSAMSNLDDSYVGVLIENSDYWYVKGLTIHNSDADWQYNGVGIWVMNSNNCTLDQIVSHHHGNSGIRCTHASEDNLILNCDSYANYDLASDGENADGIEFAFITYRAGDLRENTIRGCRLWNNSDDGIDLYNGDGYYLIENTWAWKSGYVHGADTTCGGNGSGFKLGNTSVDLSASLGRTIRNCVVFGNKLHGLDQNGANTIMHVYHNTIYDNTSVGVAFHYLSLDNAHVFRNNISFGNGDDWFGDHTNATIDHNSYDATWEPLGPESTSVDFVSLDTAGVSGARQPDGSLPIITFLHLVDGSDLKDAGTAVGVNTDADGTPRGYLPDIGAYELEDIRMLVNSTGGLILNNNKRVTIRR